MLTNYLRFRSISRKFLSQAKRQNYYEILGLTPAASSTEIRKQFFQLAKTEHPDISSDPNASEKFKQISEAYAVLSIDNLREEYDKKMDINQTLSEQESISKEWQSTCFEHFWGFDRFLNNRNPERSQRRRQLEGILLELPVREKPAGTARRRKEAIRDSPAIQRIHGQEILPQPEIPSRRRLQPV